MIRKTVPSGNKKFVYYVCGNHKADRTICSSHNINAEKLEQSVLLTLNKQIESVTDLDSILGKLEEVQKQNGELAKRNRQVIKKKEEIQKYCNLRLSLYEDYKEELITKEEYMELKETYGRRIQDAEQGLAALEEGIELLAAGFGRTCNWMNEFKKYGYLEELSREVVVSLIDKICIYEKKDGERYPRIEVRFRYAEEFEAALSLIEDVSSDRCGLPEEKGEAGYGKNKSED